MNNPLKIIAGESIPYVKDAFETLGHITFLPGRSITSAEVKNANVLLVRSITKVDENLLRGTAVEFVGSASAGIDHIDTAYLQSRNIGYASAHGSNANSVAEYVMASMLVLASRQGIALAGKTIGIVGVGHIGKLVKQKAEALGMHPVLYDPPLDETGQINQSSFPETLGCDVVTLHTPLTRSGPYPTYHLINDRTITYLKPSSIFINAARGEVVETQALLDAITQKRIGSVALDVWEHEPNIHWELFNTVAIGTPHIAGHSLDGKANGTNMIYQALCRHLGAKPIWNPTQSLPLPIVPTFEITPSQESDEEQIRKIATTIYDVEGDHRQMKTLLTAPLEERPALFDGLRKNYPVRREFHQTSLKLPKNRKSLRPLFEELGFAEITFTT